METKIKIGFVTCLVIFGLLTFGNWGIMAVSVFLFVTVLPILLIIPTIKGFYIDINDRFLSRKGNLKFYGYYDKLEHAFFYDPLVFGFVTFMYWLAKTPFDTRWLINATLATLALGMGKELFDSSYFAKTRKGILQGDGFSIKDLIADIVGLAVIVIIIIIFIF